MMLTSSSRSILVELPLPRLQHRFKPPPARRFRLIIWFSVRSTPQLLHRQHSPLLQPPPNWRNVGHGPLLADAVSATLDLCAARLRNSRLSSSTLRLYEPRLRLNKPGSSSSLANVALKKRKRPPPLRKLKAIRLPRLPALSGRFGSSCQLCLPYRQRLRKTARLSSPIFSIGSTTPRQRYAHHRRQHNRPTRNRPCTGVVVVYALHLF